MTARVELLTRPHKLGIVGLLLETLLVALARRFTYTEE